MENVIMIHLTRLNRTPLFLNSDLIEHLQSTPDTVITLTSGHNFMVLRVASGNHFSHCSVSASDQFGVADRRIGEPLSGGGRCRRLKGPA